MTTVMTISSILSSLSQSRILSSLQRRLQLILVRVQPGG